MLPENLYDLLVPILREAADLLLSAHTVEGAEISAKPGTANFVTVYDMRVQELLLRRLRDCFPGAAFVAEEKENDPAVLMEEVCFIIDPIDATTNFIHDYHHSCISLALVSHGEAVFGAVLDPYLDELFHAERGKGAYLNGKPIRVSDREMPVALAAFGTSPYDKAAFTELTFRLSEEIFLAGADLRRCGSAALDLAYTAAGRNDLFFEFRLSPWDVAAGALLVREAGGIISDMQGRPIHFSAPLPVIAANPRIYPELLERTKKYGV